MDLQTLLGQIGYDPEEVENQLDASVHELQKLIEEGTFSTEAGLSGYAAILAIGAFAYAKATYNLLKQTDDEDGSTVVVKVKPE